MSQMRPKRGPHTPSQGAPQTIPILLHTEPERPRTGRSSPTRAEHRERPRHEKGRAIPAVLCVTGLAWRSLGLAPARLWNISVSGSVYGTRCALAGQARGIALLWVSTTDHGGARRRQPRRQGEGFQHRLWHHLSAAMLRKRPAWSRGTVFVEHAEGPVRVCTRNGRWFMKGSRAESARDDVCEESA